MRRNKRGFTPQEGGGESEAFPHAGKFGVMIEAMLLEIAGEPCAADFAYCILLCALIDRWIDR